MSVYRRHKEKNYTCIANDLFNDKTLSMKAKGLLAQILSLPENWKYSVNGLASLFSDGRDAVNGAINELIEHGYIVRTKTVNEAGLFDGYVYDIYEKPQTDNEKIADFPFTDNPFTDNPTVSNTNILNTKDIYIKEKSEKPKFVPPTLEEVAAYCKERNNNVDPKQFFDYYSTGEWKDAKGNPVKNWKQKIITWEKQNADARPRSKGYKSTAWVTGEEAGIVFSENEANEHSSATDKEISSDILNMFGE